MPRCVLGEHCQYPDLALRSGHKCCRCQQRVHVLCALEDPHAGASDNLICFFCTIPPKFTPPACHDSNNISSPSRAVRNLPSPRTPTKEPSPRQEPMQRRTSPRRQKIQSIPVPPPTRAMPSKDKIPVSKRKPAPTKQQKNTPSTSNNTKPKSKVMKEFQLDADNSKPDPLLMKAVAFDVDDKLYGTKLYEHFGGDNLAKKYIATRNSKRFLLGTIIRQSKKKRGQSASSSTVHYDVQWEESDLGDTSIGLSVVIDAIALHQTISTPKKATPLPSRKSRNRDPFSPEVRNVLLSVDETEQGRPESSDEDEDGDDKDDVDKDDLVFFPHPLFDNISRQKSIVDEDDEEDPGEGSDFRWTTGNLPPPPDCSNRRESHVIPSKTGIFATPVSSFLAFIPLKIFNSIAFYSNLYAHHIIETSESGNVSGRRWETDISINEIMKFFGILFKMVLRPTPGQSYPFCWNDTQWHPYTVHMRLRRFQQIRSVLHFNDNSNIDGSNDAAFKVRPLLNCVKITFPKYLELGDEVALDEASVSCRSRYGADVIFYNPRKPGGKFHFRFYMLCCSTSYACIRLRMHTRNKADVADAPMSPSVVPRAKAGPKTTGLSGDENTDSTDEDTEDEAEEKEDKQLTVSTGKKAGNVLLSLIMDMCHPLFGSGRIVNMDNYYTSPMVAWMLSQEKVYMRGTCRTNRIGFPSGIAFSSLEKNRLGRGTIKGMIEKRKRIAAFGWLDGNPVHFLTTADGNGVTSVIRRVGRERKAIEAPSGIRNYNAGMQAVDRHDQLREGFSLSGRHGFKKYYQKIALGLIDMAVVNAWIHYKLVHPEKCSNERARYEFMDTMANSLLEINWQDYYQTEVPAESDDILHLLTRNKRQERKRRRSDDDDSVEQVVPEDQGNSPNRCTPIAVQQLMSGKRSKKKGLSCQVCSFEGRGGNIIQNVVACVQHRIRACTTTREDRNLKQSDGSDVIDYSWRAPMPGASCWDKIHNFYIPNGLFRDYMEPMSPDEKMEFQCCRVSSKLYRKRREALGETSMHRGRKRGNNCKHNELDESQDDLDLDDNHKIDDMDDNEQDRDMVAV